MTREAVGPANSCGVPTTGFSLGRYARLLDALTSGGHRVVDYSEADPSAPHLILRHDVDVCLERALSMAEVEAGIGLTATYFVLLNGPFYDPREDENEARLARIASLGHHVGLHFDASLYRGEDLQEAIEAECAQLEELLARRVATISFHRPAKELLGHPELLAGRLHAYLPRFFHEMGYCSDSRGGWYHGEPLRHPAMGRGTALQLLTHPIWWVAEDHESAVDKLVRLADGRSAEFRRHLSEHVTPYREVYDATS